MHRTTKEMRAAIEAYYSNRDRNGTDGYKWDKQADIQAIFDSCPKEADDKLFVTYMEGSAGTFLLWWSDKSQTLHKQSCVEGVLFSRTIGDSVHVYTDICGDPLPSPEIRPLKF